MNKSKKSVNTVSRAESVLDSKKAASAIEPDGSSLRELTQHTSPVWKPFEPERSQEKQNDIWFSLAYDLLHTFDELAIFFRHELQHRYWLNAYLLAVGMNQIVEDFIHAEPYLAKRAINLLGKLPEPLGPSLSKAGRSLVNMWMKINWNRPTTQKIIDWQQKLAKLINELAVIIANPDSVDTTAANQVVADGGTLMAYVPYFSVTLRNAIVKLPSCFRSFDQQPEDFKRVVDEFTLNWHDRHRPITVLGLRTSGSYLAPLYAAYLKSQGYWNIQVRTIRPGSRLMEKEKEAFNEVAVNDSLVLVCDDPPISGSALSKVCHFLEQTGVSSRNIVLFLQLFGEYESLPASLQKYPSVLMSWKNWSVHQQMEAGAIERILAEACEPSYRISEVVRLPALTNAGVRGHLRDYYHVTLLDAETNQVCTRLVQVTGVGLGYYGEHALVILQKLGTFSPQLISFRNGLLIQELPMPAQTLATSLEISGDVIVEHLVDYIIERNRQLPAKQDTSLRLSGQTAVWEVASDILSRTFGFGRLLARVPLVDPYIKKQLKSSNPSIVDGDMDLNHWYVQDGTIPALIKTDSAERDFSHLDLFSYDPIYDLASLAVECEHFLGPSLLRDSYEAKSGNKVSLESWMLYQMVHLWDINRLVPGISSQTDRRMAQVVQRYFSDVYFRDLPVVTDGPVCAIDIDGVLETKQLGFPSISAAGVRSIRALTLHGNRVILVTGRSLGELKERCAAYHLSGGVAEYGAVTYDHVSDEAVSLLTDEEIENLFMIRSRLSNKYGIYLDNDYRFAVRAYCLDENGKRMHLSLQTIKEVLVETGTSNEVYAIQGEAQTDFMVKRINKGIGLEQWVVRFTDMAHTLTVFAESKPIAFAVGDTASDLPMFTLAKMAYAPANASQDVQQSGVPITRSPYQRGLEQAVTEFLAHKPGTCESCRMEKLPPLTTYMQEVLSLQENGTASMVWKALKLALTQRGRMNNGIT